MMRAPLPRAEWATCGVGGVRGGRRAGWVTCGVGRGRSETSTSDNRRNVSAAPGGHT